MLGASGATPHRLMPTALRSVGRRVLSRENGLRSVKVRCRLSGRVAVIGGLVEGVDMGVDVAAGDVMVEALEALVTSGVRHGLTVSGERRVRYFVMGAGSQCVVLEPGACVAASTWFPVLPALSQCARVVLYDRAGFGGTDPAARPSLWTALEDLRAVLVEVAAGGPCVLVGHSWGGLLVQMLALAHPGLVSGLVLVDAAHEQSWLEIPADELERIARSDQEIDFDECVVEQTEMARAAARGATDDPVLADLLVRADLGYAATPGQVRASASELPLIVASLDELVRRRRAAPPSSVPTVVLTAMKGRPEQYRQPVLDREESLVASMPRARHEVVWDAGHYIHLDQPHHVIDAVRSVLPQNG